MDSTRFIAFRDERTTPVCYDDPALTFGRVPERPAQQTVVPAGAILLQGRIQPVIPRRASVPSSRRPCQQGGAILVPARCPSRRVPASFPSPAAKVGQRVHSPGIRLGPDPPVGVRPFVGSSLFVVVRAAVSAAVPCRRHFRLRRHAPPCLPRGSGHPPPAPCSSASRSPARAIGQEIAGSLKQW